MSVFAVVSFAVFAAAAIALVFEVVGAIFVAVALEAIAEGGAE